MENHDTYIYENYWATLHRPLACTMGFKNTFDNILSNPFHMNYRGFWLNS